MNSDPNGFGQMPGADTPASHAEASHDAPPRTRVVEALMRLASDRPWVDIEIVDIAQEAGVTLSEMRDLFPSKGAILEGYTRMIDKTVIEGTSGDLVGEPARERIFDIVMRRLDAMTPHKEALRRISMAMRRDALSLIALNRSGLNSARYMLAAAGVPTEGPLGFVKLQGFVITLSRVMETWFDDEEQASARTMAKLDEELGRGERVMERAEDIRRFTAPLRAMGQAMMDGRSRMRRSYRSRDEREAGETTDPAGAI